MSYRHITPVVDYSGLDLLVPDAMLTTIARDPVTKFNSMFNFVKPTLRKYRSAGNFVKAVLRGEATVDEMNDLCNNFAYSLSGEKETLGRLDGEESEAYAKDMIERMEGRGMFVMIMEKLPESLVVVCEGMGWDCYSGSMSFKATSERKNTDPGNVKCKDPACEEEILKCNMVDKILYEHYKEKLGEITRGIEGFEEKLEMLKGVMEKSTGNKQKYPVSCRGQVKNEFDQMHSCKGNLTP
ncbi:hypothetical protein TrRE_jg2987 [Triparma retinervis]|uniref:Sulfotransferase n=1 Tax=Triparma retinervis TaxID=2557542 RepID=A0A9W7A4D1_9STRA|nr:hypothetical protein TrRE_jg2987 [Triparma retinervis]